MAFCNPLKSFTCNHGHERGLNEYHNGLLREHFPKKNFKQVLAKEIMAACNSINDRPSKTLKWEIETLNLTRI